MANNVPQLRSIPTIVESYSHLDFAVRNTKRFARKQVNQEILISLIPASIAALITWIITGSWGFLGLAAAIFGTLTFGVLLFVKFCYFYWIAPRRQAERLQRQLQRSQDETDLAVEELNASRETLALQKDAFEKRIERYQQPQLKSTIQRILMGVAEIRQKNVQDGSERVIKNTIIAPMIGVQNTGAPSITQNWRLKVNLTNTDERLEIGAYGAIGPMTFGMDSDGGFTIEEGDNIINKAGPGHPIGNGDMVNGAVMFIVPATQEAVNVTGTELILEFEDINGRVYSETFNKFPYEPSYSRPYLPGLKMKPARSNDGDKSQEDC